MRKLRGRRGRRLREGSGCAGCQKEEDSKKLRFSSMHIGAFLLILSADEPFRKDDLILL
jgi:hypothetical protein